MKKYRPRSIIVLLLILSLSLKALARKSYSVLELHDGYVASLDEEKEQEDEESHFVLHVDQQQVGTA